MTLSGSPKNKHGTCIQPYLPLWSSTTISVLWVSGSLPPNKGSPNFAYKVQLVNVFGIWGQAVSVTQTQLVVPPQTKATIIHNDDAYMNEYGQIWPAFGLNHSSRSYCYILWWEGKGRGKFRICLSCFISLHRRQLPLSRQRPRRGKDTLSKQSPYNGKECICITQPCVL